MIKAISSLGVKYPKAVVVTMLLLTGFLAYQLKDGLQWETDARVYLPKGHEAILYDEKVDEIFGVKDQVIIAVVNEEEGIFNQETLQRIKRITEKVKALPGVQANRNIDVTSISSATYFTGDETSIASLPLMESVPTTDEEMEALRKRVFDNADLFVGNIVSADGTAAMIRAKLKEGMQHRYMTYFQIKGILSAEDGEGAGWEMGAWGGNKWQGGADDWKKWQKGVAEDEAAEAEKNDKATQQWGGEWPEGSEDGSNPWWPGDQGDKAADTSESTQETEGANPWWPGNEEEKTTASTTEPAKEETSQEQTTEGNPWWPGNDTESASADSAGESKAVEEDTTEGNPWWPGNKEEQASSVDSEPVEVSTEGNPWRTGTSADQAATTESDTADNQGSGENPWWPGNGAEDDNQESGEKAVAESEAKKENNDKFYLAGRPVIEVTSGIYAMDDMKLMIPMIIIAMAVVLFLIFRTLRGVVMPLMVMSFAIIWTMGMMVVFDVPLYTISTMLPVILVAVGIGDAVHMMSSYYDAALKDIHRKSREIVAETVEGLGAPLITTSVTTAIGFLALLFAEMPPFRVFGVFAMLGILFSWLITITLIPALLTLLKPKVGGYYAKRRAMRVYEEQSRLALLLTKKGDWINQHRGVAVGALAAVVVIAAIGASKVFVNSSWLSDFKEDSEVALSTSMLNEKFAGTTFLHVVIESDQKDMLKSPELLKKIDALQGYVETLPYVGDSLSVVDYLENINMNLHAGDKAYNVLPETRAQIGEYLFLMSVSGRPELLDEVVDLDYKRGLVSISMKTDYTRELKQTIDAVRAYVDREFNGLGVDVNLAGSANNSYIWGHLLIDSQTTAIVLSKVGILAIAALIFMSFFAGVYVVVPVTLSTLLVAGVSGFFSIPLDVSTALAAGIAIGVGVDYAVHYIFRYQRERRQGKDHEAATAATLRTTGRAIVLNATVVTLGFAVLAFSQFPPHVKLGYFVSAYMVVSCLVAIFVLPALFSYFRPRFVEKQAG